MTPRQAELLDLAIRNDDTFPDDVCPGCGQNIEGWEHYQGHFVGDLESRSRTTIVSRTNGLRAPWPFADGWSDGDDVCPWTRDYLVARAHRRRYIATHLGATA